MARAATVHRVRPLRLALRAVAVVVAVVVAYLAVTAVQVWLTGRRYEPRSAGAIVVMGAAQYNGVPSPDLAARLHQAFVLWTDRYATDIMVTGFKERGDRFTEAQASARYLMADGVPDRD